MSKGAGGPVGPPWTIEGTAVALGGYAWLENRLFEVLGRLAASPGVPPQMRVLALAHAAHHAWHAELWRARIPLLPHLPVPAVVVPPDPAAENLLDATDPKLVLSTVCRVILPGLVDVYERHLGGASPISDGPVIRALELVLADERRDLSEGIAALEGLERDLARAYRGA